MKQLLILALTALMVLAFSATALAGTFYLDYGLSGVANDSSNPDFDIKNAYLLGVDAPLNAWFVGFEYWAGNVDDGGETPFGGYTLRGGYSFLSNDATRVTVTLGLINETIEISGGDLTLENVIAIGLDAEFTFDNNFALQFTLDYGVSGMEADFGGPADLDLVLNYKLKFSYLFNDTMGVSLSYYYKSFEFDGAPDPWFFSGYTLGFVYKF